MNVHYRQRYIVVSDKGTFCKSLWIEASAKRPECKPFGCVRTGSASPAGLAGRDGLHLGAATCHRARSRLPSACSFCEMRIVSISAFKAPTSEKIWVAAAQTLCVGKKSKFKQTHKQNLYRSFDLVDVIVERRLSLGIYLVSFGFSSLKS